MPRRALRSSRAPAADCTGNADNRTFFAGVAAQVEWTVVCAVLPKHWFVSSGTFRLAKGGRLLISYKGPDGATLSLSEGAWSSTRTAASRRGPISAPRRWGRWRAR